MDLIDKCQKEMEELKKWEPKIQAEISSSLSTKQVLLVSIWRVEDSAIDRYWKFDVNKSTIAWLFFIN